MIASRFRFVRIAFCTALFACGLGAHSAAAEQSIQDGTLPNNFPFLNQAGTAATYSTEGFLDLDNAFHIPQGQNGRTCESCHLVLESIAVYQEGLRFAQQYVFGVGVAAARVCSALSLPST